MLRKYRRYFYLPVATAFLILAAVGISQIVNAEGNNQFPGVNTGNDWNFDSRSPDPRLTWLYKGSGPNETINNTTTHILRNRSLGRNIGTTLRVYYTYRPQVVRVTINVVDCQLDAPNPYDGRVVVRLGGDVKYNQQTRDNKYDYWYDQRDFLTAGSQRTNTVNEPRGNGGAYPNSPVCNNPGSYDIPVHIYRENCNNPGPNNTCNGNGTETYTADTSGNGTRQINPPNTRLTGSTFETGFPSSGNGNASIGYDPDINLYFADLDVELTASDDTDVPPDVMQRMSFKVTANDVPRADNGNNMNAKMGYRFTATEADGSKYFGLQGNGGGDDRYDGYGQKFAIPFGLTCAENTEFDKRIVIYDPDVAGYGPSYAAVFKKGPSNPNDPNSPIVIERLEKNEYNLSPGDNVSWDNSTNDRIELTAGNNANSVFRVREMSKGYQYMLVIVNPSATSYPPSTNVWSVKLPSDSINGLINCRYNLVPGLNGVKSAFNTYGDTVNPHGWITNAEGTGATGDHEWRITKAVFANRPADLSRTGVVNSNDNEQPCQFITRLSGTPLSCSSAFTSSYPGDSDETLPPQAIGPHPVGTYVCYITSIKDPTWLPTDDTKWAHSTMQCSVGSVKPKLQVWGGDVKSGSSINTSLTQTNGTTYGSWGEYGVASNSRNVGMASGSGLLGGDSNNQSDWSALTFSNSNPFVLGNFGGVMPLAYTPPSSTEANCSLGARPYGAGEKAVIQCAGTLTITGNQTFAADYSSISAIPNIKIIADNIVIAAGVDRIDPWLIARSSTGAYGSISTCDQVPGFLQYGALNGSLLSATRCGVPIKFNGPVIADKLYLYRTHDEQTGNVAAETFNLRADNILSSYNGSGVDQPVARTELITELPPRF